MRKAQRRTAGASLLFALLCPFGVANAQETYALSLRVREFATKNKVDEKLRSPKESALYDDTLTAIDLIAKERAKVLHRENSVTEEDYEAAGWILCVIPWTPPKSPADVEKMTKLRPSLVDGVFRSKERRAQIIERLDRNRLAFSAKEIEKGKLRPFDILKIEKPE